MDGRACSTMHFCLGLIGCCSMADGLFKFGHNPDASFAFGLGLCIPMMIETGVWLFRITKELRA